MSTPLASIPHRSTQKVHMERKTLIQRRRSLAIISLDVDLLHTPEEPAKAACDLGPGLFYAARM